MEAEPPLLEALVALRLGMVNATTFFPNKNLRNIHLTFQASGNKLSALHLGVRLLKHNTACYPTWLMTMPCFTKVSLDCCFQIERPILSFTCNRGNQSPPQSDTAADSPLEYAKAIAERKAYRRPEEKANWLKRN
ncbi:MAG: hypothetical protein IPJ06_19855 [Saprospiraceae bacterium]|nr:hypothetical protein [Saprospiraceae bacterium]